MQNNHDRMIHMGDDMATARLVLAGVVAALLTAGCSLTGAAGLGAQPGGVPIYNPERTQLRADERDPAPDFLIVSDYLVTALSADRRVVVHKFVIDSDTCTREAARVFVRSLQEGNRMNAYCSVRGPTGTYAVKDFYILPDRPVVEAPPSAAPKPAPIQPTKKFAGPEWDA